MDEITVNDAQTIFNNRDMFMKYVAAKLFCNNNFMTNRTLNAVQCAKTAISAAEILCNQLFNKETPINE